MKLAMAKPEKMTSPLSLSFYNTSPQTSFKKPLIDINQIMNHDLVEIIFFKISILCIAHKREVEGDEVPLSFERQPPCLCPHLLLIILVPSSSFSFSVFILYDRLLQDRTVLYD